MRARLHLNNYFEQEKRAQGFRLVAGADEAGRGPWAGPLVAAAVIMPPDYTSTIVHDSKRLSEKRRREAFTEITQTAVAWQVVTVLPAAIDHRGLAWANNFALSESIARLSIPPDFAFIDGFSVPTTMPGQNVIHGDSTVLSIACASIIAKVLRDDMMQNLHAQYPKYGFADHKGYGTKAHQAALRAHGPCRIHRFSFAPILKAKRRHP